MERKEGKVIFWNNNSTIVDSIEPNSNVREALPGVKETMSKFIITGIKSPDSEKQNFDSELIIKRLSKLMGELPIDAVAFSPQIGKTTCYVMLRNNIIKIHEKERYKELDTETFIVMKNIASEVFGQEITSEHSLMIGDSWQDQADSFGVPFIHTHSIHTEQRTNIF